jgi:hypothetical protein
MDSDQWAEVSLGVFVWVEVAGESPLRDVVDWSNVFDVSGILSLAAHPNSVQLKH